MIITTLLGALFNPLNTATPLQPYNVTRVDNYTTRVYVAHDTTLHLSNTQGFAILVTNASDRYNLVSNNVGVKSYDIKVKQGNTYNITAVSRFNGGTFKVGHTQVTQKPINWKSLTNSTKKVDNPFN